MSGSQHTSRVYRCSSEISTIIMCDKAWGNRLRFTQPVRRVQNNDIYSRDEFGLHSKLQLKSCHRCNSINYKTNCWALTNRIRHRFGVTSGHPSALRSEAGGGGGLLPSCCVQMSAELWCRILRKAVKQVIHLSPLHGGRSTQAQFEYQPGWSTEGPGCRADWSRAPTPTVRSHHAARAHAMSQPDDQSPTSKNAPHGVPTHLPR